MIDLRPYQNTDFYCLWPELHYVSKAELGDASPRFIQDLISDMHLTTAIRDGFVVFVAGTSPTREKNVRSTMFLFARGFDRVVGFGLRSWTEREKKIYPDTEFSIYSAGEHPMKARFLAVAGVKHRAGPFYSTAS